MAQSTLAATSLAYQNPVFAHNFPDPFVLKYCGEYWAYGTGIWRDGRAFGILRSRDLMNWQEIGGAMPPLPGNHPCYWAPEVTYDNGRFYLYYSVGDETNMHIRVATAGHPAGPFEDSGHRLTREQFAIDAHVFTDGAGSRFLFYATDFLDHHRIGTGTVNDRMLDPYTLAGNPLPVTRALFDWQIYDPQRVEKGGVRWHTLEGPFVLRHKGTYYQLFSGGNWHNPSYGVGYATTESLDAPGEWLQVADGNIILPVLRSVPDAVIGPGHNSVVRGPDNRQLYCIYHRWDMGRNGRQLAIDRLDFAGQRLLVLGPSDSAQAAPLSPSFADFLSGTDRSGLGGVWEEDGLWWVADGVAQPADGQADAFAAYPLAQPAFWSEVSLRAPSSSTGAYGLQLQQASQVVLRFQLLPEQNKALIRCRNGAGWEAHPVALPDSFDHESYHLARVEVDGRRARLALDDVLLDWRGVLVASPDKIALFAEQIQPDFTAFSLTYGWESDFADVASPAAAGWRSAQSESWRIDRRQLCVHQPAGQTVASKGPLPPAYELVINARLDEIHHQGGGYGFSPALTDDNDGPLLLIVRFEDQWQMQIETGEEVTRVPLPESFDPTVYQQFRMREANGRLGIHWENHPITTISVARGAVGVGLVSRQATACFDMARITHIAEGI